MNDSMSIVSSFMNRLASSLDLLGNLFLAFMFVASIWKPQRIFNQGAFRLAMILFAFSVASPAIVSGIWNLVNAASEDLDSSSSSESFREQADSTRTMMYITAFTHDCSRVMLAIAACCGVLSLVEPDYLRNRRERAELAAAARTPVAATPPRPDVAMPPIRLDE